MSEPKKHHYTPQMLLRRFTDSNGNLYFFDKRIRAKGVLSSKPKDVFFKKHLYSLMNKDGSRNTALEKYFSQIEGAADQIINKIITAAEKGLAPHLSASEKKEWDNFVYRQWIRVPDLHIETLDNFDEAYADAIEKFETKFRPLTDEERASFRQPEVITRIKQNAHIQALGSPPGMAVEALGMKGLCTAIITRSNKNFIIGSFPVAKLTLPGRTNLLDPSTELWLPISSKVAVSPAGSSGTELFVKVSEDRHIRGLNEAIYKQSTLIAGNSKALIASMAKIQQR